MIYTVLFRVKDVVSIQNIEAKSFDHAKFLLQKQHPNAVGFHNLANRTPARGFEKSDE